MQSVRRLIALAILALWLPATSHCAIEAAGWAAIIPCPVAHADDGGCCDADAPDACNVIEGASYRLNDGTAAVPAPALCACLLCFVEAPAAVVIAPPVGVSDRAAVPPEIGRAWRFAARAVAPPRAPDFVS